MLNPESRLFVLDTNVLMHDPTAIFRFKEHDIFIPMVVLEELDHGKKGMSEVARNVRQVSRFLDELLFGVDPAALKDGLPLPEVTNKNDGSSEKHGRLFFQTEKLCDEMPLTLPGNTPDNNILCTCLALEKKLSETRITLVSKDINLRIKASVVGLHSEDYSNDQVLDDVDLLYSGVAELPDDFWESHAKQIDSWQEEGRTFYRVSGDDLRDWYPNQFLYMEGDNPLEARVVEVGDDAIIELVDDFRQKKHNVWGINARNREQNLALNLLMDSELDFVTLLGAAGTGKTLLSLAAGLAQVLDKNRYREIIMTRVTVPVGEDIGFLPGTEEEKMTPWMGALMDNLEVLTQTDPQAGSWGQDAAADLVRNRIRIHSLNFMRGRTFLNKFIIIDEAQNLTAKQMKTLITRAGPGSKVVCLGNVAQIDTPYLTETSSGLTYVVDRFKQWPHSGHITLQRGERSRLADFASQAL